MIPHNIRTVATDTETCMITNAKYLTWIPPVILSLCFYIYCSDESANRSSSRPEWRPATPSSSSDHTSPGPWSADSRLTCDSTTLRRSTTPYARRPQSGNSGGPTAGTSPRRMPSPTPRTKRSQTSCLPSIEHGIQGCIHTSKGQPFQNADLGPNHKKREGSQQLSRI